MLDKLEIGYIIEKTQEDEMEYTIRTHRKSERELGFASETHTCEVCGREGNYWSEAEPDGEGWLGGPIHHCQRCRGAARKQAELNVPPSMR